MTFKVGDKVEVIKSYDDYKVGHIGVITSIQEYSYRDTYYRIDGASGGSTADFFKKVEDKPMFKYNVGDTVKVVKKTGYFGFHRLDIGKEYKIKEQYNNKGLDKIGYRLENIDGSLTTYYNHVGEDEIEKVDDMFEDGWILNDGKVTIPDDAQKSMHEGSVVAFRKRKTPPLEFGDKVMYEGELCIYLRKDRINDALVVLARKNESNISRHPSKITKV